MQGLRPPHPAKSDRELLCKIVQRVERMAGVKALLILPVAALCLAVVPERIGTDQFMPNPQLGGRLLKQRRQVTFTAGKTVGKLKAVVRLDTLHFSAGNSLILRMTRYRLFGQRV